MIRILFLSALVSVLLVACSNERPRSLEALNESMDSMNTSLDALDAE